MRQKGAKIFVGPNQKAGYCTVIRRASSAKPILKEAAHDPFWSKYPTNCRNGGE
jgi:hypothetical protein